MNLLPIVLVVQGVAFLVWAFLAFRWLFAMRADAVARSGQTLPNMATQLQVFRDGFVEPRYRSHRVRLLLATAVLVALTVLSAFAMG